MQRLNQDKTTGLLNELVVATGCYYLSDLHHRDNAGAVAAAAARIGAERYSVKEWLEAAAYILQDGAVTADTAEQIKLLLQQRLQAE